MRFPVVLVVVMLCACELFAQPEDLDYEPPAGWMYVRNVDSISSFHLKVYNDSIVTYGYNRKATLPQMWLKQISVDGGATWDTIHIKNLQYTQFGYSASEGFLPLSSRYYRAQYDNSFKRYVLLLSNDLGKTFADTLVIIADATWSYPNNFPPRLLFKPNDPNQLFYLVGPQVFRSSDAGNTWVSQKVPKITGFRDNNGADITFDQRNPKLWYFLVSGDAHHAGGWIDYYRTRDDGVTFEPIKFLPKYSGIASQGVMRNPWTHQLYEYGKGTYFFPVGMVDFLDNSDTLKHHNWAAKLYGSSYPNLPKGEYNFIDNYIFLKKNPHIAFISGGREEGKDSMSAPPKKRRYDLWKTINDGETWESIWPSEPAASSMYLDEKTNTLYVQSTYSEDFYNQTLPRRSELWKRQITTSVEDELHFPTDFTNVRIAPHPIESFTEISFKNSTFGKVEIALHDILGSKVRTIYSGTQEAGEQKLIWNIPSEIPSGTYFLKIESGEKNVTEKIFITR
ncbi:MAG TPA: T9SS type A sorting domain-containing protein [Patescibacteria group bacterium]|nr:T9SS type A sorting domain-containing protein [Patescibacteria group bacterium]